MPTTRQERILGRERELAALEDLIDGVSDRGGALELSGEPGIGKSALMRESARRATARGMRVLRASGVQSEAHLPFAGLHQLLRPVLGGVDELPAPQRAALLAAFGMSEESAPDLFLIALAVLDLLAEAAAASPHLLVVEDAHWMDPASSDVLAFVARRLESDPIVLLAAVREGFETPFRDAGLAELSLGRLDDSFSAALLDAGAPGLPPALRDRILDGAAGNPLALVELPVASAALGDGALPPAWLPLTTRLEQAFAARVAGLPAATRTLLLVAALNDDRQPAELLEAGALVAGAALRWGELAPAVAARLVEVDERELRFRRSSGRPGSSATPGGAPTGCCARRSWRSSSAVASSWPAFCARSTRSSSARWTGRARPGSARASTTESPARPPEHGRWRRPRSRRWRPAGPSSR